MKSTLQEIASRLSTLNLPVAYDHFLTPQQPPFVCYKQSEVQIQGAYNKNLYKKSVITIELYTKSKDLAKEKAVETLFDDVELSVYQDYISEENVFLTEYEFEYIEKI